MWGGLSTEVTQEIKRKGEFSGNKKKNEIAKIQAKKELFPFVFPDGILCKKPAYVFSS